MRRITYWALSTLSALVLLFSYRTSTSSAFATTTSRAAAATSSGATSSDSGTGSGSSGSTGSSGSSGSTGSSDSSADTSGGSSSSAATTYTGDAVSTRYGNVQVKITVENGKVTASEVTQVPWNDHKDQEINSYAVPILNSEAVSAQSASIDMVSGATYTSEGYIQSLQSALDQAHLS